MDISSFKVSGTVAPTQVEIPKGDVQPINTPMTHVQEAALLSGEQPAQEPEVNTQEASSEETPTQEEEVKPARVDPKFSILARKEAALHKQREQLKTERAQIEAAAKRIADLEAISQNAKSNPIKALEALGLDYDSVTEFVMNSKNPANAEVAAVRQEVERLRQETLEAQQRAEQAAEEKLALESQAVIDTFRQNAVNFVLSNADKYEWTIAEDGASLVHEVIEQDFEERGDGKVMSFQEAADLVEKYFEKRQERIVATKKFQARYGQKSAAVESTQQPANIPAPKRPSTLSNAMTASASAQAPKHRTEQDRIKAALARLEGR